MPDYFTQVVVQPSIPNACMTPPERWLLGQMFEVEEEDDDTTCFFTGEGVSSTADGGDPVLGTALRDDDSRRAALVRDAEAAADGAWLDLDPINYEMVFQAIMARHPDEVPYITVEKAFTCSRMLPDGFGGAAELITADQVRWTSTSLWLDEQLGALKTKAADGAADTQA